MLELMTTGIVRINSKFQKIIAFLQHGKEIHIKLYSIHKSNQGRFPYFDQ